MGGHWTEQESEMALLQNQKPFPGNSNRLLLTIQSPIEYEYNTKIEPRVSSIP